MDVETQTRRPNVNRTCEDSLLTFRRDSIFIENHISKHALLEIKIYHKMQREKFYHQNRKTYFNCVLFVFKKTQNYVRPTFEVAAEL